MRKPILVGFALLSIFILPSFARANTYPALTVCGPEAKYNSLTGLPCPNNFPSISFFSPHGGEVWQEAPRITDTISGFEQYRQDIRWSGAPDDYNIVSAYLEQQVPGGTYVTVGRIPPFAYGSIQWVVGVVGTPTCDLIYASDRPNNCFNKINMRVVPPGQYNIRLVNTQTGEWGRSVAFTLVSSSSTPGCPAGAKYSFLTGILCGSVPPSSFTLSDSDDSPDYHLGLPSPSQISPQSYPDLFVRGVGRGHYSSGAFPAIYGLSATQAMQPTTDSYSTYYDNCSGPQQLNEAFMDSKTGNLEATAVNPPSGYICSNGAFVWAGPGFPNSGPITVNSPGGGELWYTGETHQISWSSVPGASFYQLYLNRTIGDTTRFPMYIGQANDSSKVYSYYSWSIPKNLVDLAKSLTGLSIDVRAYNNAKEAVLLEKGKSNTFTVSNGNTSTQCGSVHVTFPGVSGSGVWAGGQYTLTWTGFDPCSASGSALFSVYLVGGPNGSNWSRFLGTVSVYQNSVPVTIPTDIPPGSGYQFQLSGPGVSGDNSDSFTVTSSQVPPQPLRIVSPNGGETYQIGNQMNISWVSSIAGSVAINLDNIDNGQRYGTISASSVDAKLGSISFVIGNNFPPGRYKAVVVLTDGYNPNGGNVTPTDSSDTYFTITGATTPTQNISVASPTGGETWTLGSSQSIQYTSSGLSGRVVNSFLGPLNDGTYTQLSVGTTIPSSGNNTLTFTLPSWVSPGRYGIRLEVVNTNNALIVGKSSGFVSVVSATNPTPTPTPPSITTFRTSHDLTGTIRSTTLVWDAVSDYCILNGPNFATNSRWSAHEAISTGNLSPTSARYDLACYNNAGQSDMAKLLISVPYPTQ
ncbi:MAG: hypothetical protein PHV93_01070 [Candidatus Pacebacteria bacterium]|nr:hypothetical protein [Candidatus Paceibacterota bacterium]